MKRQKETYRGKEAKDNKEEKRELGQALGNVFLSRYETKFAVRPRDLRKERKL